MPWLCKTEFSTYAIYHTLVILIPIIYKAGEAENKQIIFGIKIRQPVTTATNADISTAAAL